jgi:hypothetical protein
LSPKFTTEQRERLRARGLDPERVQSLEELLPRLVSPRPRLQEVRGKLSDLAKAAEKLQKGYTRLRASPHPASEEVRTRLDFAQEYLGYTDWNTLRQCIQTATRIIAEAWDGVSDETRRSVYRNPVGLILSALGIQQLIVTRKKQPFLEIAQIVSAASGGWNVDDAIRAYLKPKGRE